MNTTHKCVWLLQTGGCQRSAYELDADKLKEVKKEDYLKKSLHIGQLIETIKK
jgi:hypothetical protein